MNTNRLSIVISTHQAQFEALAYKGDLEANLARIAGWGYRGAELAIRDPKLVDVKQLEKIVETSGLKIPAIGTGQAWGEERLSFTSNDLEVRRKAVERVKQHIELASRFDALVIIGLIRGTTPPGQTYAQSIDFLIECLSECAEKAAGDGVRMAIEPLNRYETDLVHTVSDGLELIHKVGYCSLGILLDTFHMNIEEPVIGDGIQIAGEKIFHFHIADSNRWHPGGGHLDFKHIFQELFATGYNGWISGEFLPRPDADTAAQRCISFLKQIEL